MNKSDLRRIKKEMNKAIVNPATVVVLEDEAGKFIYTEEQQKRINSGADVIKISFYESGLL